MCSKRILSLTLLCRHPWTVTNSLPIWFFSVFSHQHFHEIQPVISMITWKRPHLYCKDCSLALVGRYLMFLRRGKEGFSTIYLPFPLPFALFSFLCVFVYYWWLNLLFPPSSSLFFLFTFLKTYFLFMLLNFYTFIKHNLIMFIHHSVPSTTSSDPHGVSLLILWPF